jgi:hypothetical protein
MEILGDSSFNNSVTSDLMGDISTLGRKITTIQNSLNTAHEKYNYCKDQGPFHSCRKHTGKSQGDWYSEIKRLELELSNAQKTRDGTQDRLDNLVASKISVATGQKVEHEQEILEQKEWAERGKKWGLYGGIALVMILGTFVVIKKFGK